MMLKCCSKQEHFSNKGMVARTQLPALDNNAITGRGQAEVQSGQHAGEGRFKVCFPQGPQTLGCKAHNSEEVIQKLITKVLQRCEAGNAEQERS